MLSLLFLSVMFVTTLSKFCGFARKDQFDNFNLTEDEFSLMITNITIVSHKPNCDSQSSLKHQNYLS